MNKGIQIYFTDHRTGRRHWFLYNGGIVSFVEYINRNKTPLHKTPVYFTAESGDLQLEVAMQYNDGYSEVMLSFANNINTHEGGTHLSGLKAALTRTLNDYARKKNLLKANEENLSGEDVREGCTAVISVRIPNPQFEGQTKTKLGNGEVRGVVESLVAEQLAAYLEENPADAKRIVDKCISAQRARQAARKARELTPQERFGNLITSR